MKFISTLCLDRVACLAGLLYAWLVARFFFLGDDGYISFRFADRFASGLGLSFNDGVTPPVEGYSEFLWVLILAATGRIGLDPEFVAPGISILCGATLWFSAVLLLGRVRPGDAMVSRVGSFLIAGCVPLAVWSTGGMATMPFALLCFWLVVALFGYGDNSRTKAACFVACATVLIRADGALWVAYVGSLGLLLGWLQKDRRLLRTAVALSASAFVVFLVHTLWRYQYYGDWLPHTARAKLGVSAFTLERGVRYVASFFLTFPALGLVWVMTPVFARGKMERLVWVLWACLPATCAYSIYTGGDFMCFGRFLLPALAPTLLAFALVAGHLRVGQALAAAAFVVGLLPAWNVSVAPQATRELVHFRFNAKGPQGAPIVRTEWEQWELMRRRARVWKDLGRAIAFHTNPKDSLVVDVIGAIGYFGQRRLFDPYGLVSPEVLARPLDRNPPDHERRSPGHDRYVPPGFFLDQNPTWLGAKYYPPGGAPPASMRTVKNAWIALDPANGFEKGAHLFLIAGPGR